MKRIRMNNTRIFIRVVVLAIITSSCISQKRVTLLQDKSVKEAQASFENKKKTTYQIQSGDHLYIRVYSLDPKTSKFFQSDLPTLMNPTYLYLNSYMVDQDGYINFSFIDKLYVKGMTIEEVRKKIQTTLNEYFKESTVTVKLVNFQIAVLGEVNDAGNFTIDKDQINILQAVALAGGFKEYGKVRKITLVRQTLTGSDVYTIDLSNKKVLESDYFYLMPNDVIYVEPLKGKSFLFTQFPYATILSTLSLTLSVLIYFEVK
jgi:polysaccharide biosynthesis/export protein